MATKQLVRWTFDEVEGRLTLEFATGRTMTIGNLTHVRAQQLLRRYEAETARRGEAAGGIFTR